MALERAYSYLTERSINQTDKFVYIEGIASTPTLDRMEDVVEPMGARFQLPMKLLLQHDHNMPVGNMTFAKPTPKGIPFKAEIPRISEPGVVKNRVDEAIHSLMYNLISAVSIGFKPIEGKVERLASGGLRFKEWLWFELSLVTIPANAEAIISVVKQFDTKTAPTLITGERVVETVKLFEPPGVSGTKPAASRGAVKLIPRKKP